MWPVAFLINRRESYDPHEPSEFRHKIQVKVYFSNKAAAAAALFVDNELCCSTSLWAEIVYIGIEVNK